MTTECRDVSGIGIRTMRRTDWPSVAKLIYESTNAWYTSQGRAPIFSCSMQDMELFCSVYETLDPGCCFVAEDTVRETIAASCFYHPRETHVSLGIMNVHPNYFGKGLASQLLRKITNISDAKGLPTRLVSSAINLDSFSLYTRQGFTPRAIYQDMIMTVPGNGLSHNVPGLDQVRDGHLEDLDALVALEMELSGIQRANDLLTFLENKAGYWHVSVYEDASGVITGYLASVAHPASRLLGPGIMREDAQAIALIHQELNHHKGNTPVWLVPSDRTMLVQKMYAWGAKNCEIHVAQARGAWVIPQGIVMPTFMPETS